MERIRGKSERGSNKRGAALKNTIVIKKIIANNGAKECKYGDGGGHSNTMLMSCSRTLGQ